MSCCVRKYRKTYSKEMKSAAREKREKEKKTQFFRAEIIIDVLRWQFKLDPSRERNIKLWSCKHRFWHPFILRTHPADVRVSSVNSKPNIFYYLKNKYIHIHIAGMDRLGIFLLGIGSMGTEMFQIAGDKKKTLLTGVNNDVPTIFNIQWSTN